MRITMTRDALERGLKPIFRVRPERLKLKPERSKLITATLIEAAKHHLK